MTFSWTTFALQAVNFLILVWLLKRFLFKPVANLVTQRKASISRAQSEAERAQRAADQARKDLEAQRAELDQQRQALIDQTRAQLADERAAMIEAARGEVEKLKAAARQQLDEERHSAGRELFAHTVQTAVELASQLLRQVAQAPLDQPFLEQALERLDRLAANERADLLGQLARDGGQQLVVTTAHPLDADSQAKWRAALSGRLGEAVRIVFTADQELIAGVRLGFPHATLRFSWRDNLTHAQSELIEHGQAG